MQLRHLGTSGLKVSLIGLGTNTLAVSGNMHGTPIGTEESRAILHAAIDLGITLIDTADIYTSGASEEAIGLALGDKRKDIVLATKFAFDGNASRDNMVRSVEASLRRLRTDWIDLYQVHRPDFHTPVEETIRGLEDLTRAGKIRYTGVSGHPAWRVVEAQMAAKAIGAPPFVSSQDEYSILSRRIERDLVAVQLRFGLGLIPYYPLAGGLLTGKHKRGAVQPGSRLAVSKNAAAMQISEQRWDAIEKLQALAVKSGRTMLELAFGWLAARPAVSSIIAGATSPAQVAANVKAAETRLTAEEVAAIDEISAGFA